jgi:hypothetical protein
MCERTHFVHLVTAKPSHSESRLSATTPLKKRKEEQQKRPILNSPLFWRDRMGQWTSGVRRNGA